MRGQAKAVNSASCNGVGNAYREQDKRVVGPPIAGEDEKQPKDEGGADADASPPNAQTEDAN